MFIGKVIGTVWSTVKWDGLSGMKMLLVRPYTLTDLGGTSSLSPTPTAPDHDGVVCADVFGAGVGDDVVVAYGHAARVAVSERLGANEAPTIPIDAAVVAIVDRFAVD